MVASLERLAPEARRRLEAIQRHADLGGGFGVASEDLEIRGAGDVLGARQSGSIQAVGFTEYTRILAEAVAELQGRPILREADPELVIDVPAFVPEAYVPDTGQRLEIYRRLADAATVDDVASVMEEMSDRFGDPPLEAVHFAYLMKCRSYARRLGAAALELAGRRFQVRLLADSPLTARVAAGLRDATGGRLRLVSGDRIATTVPRAAEGRDRRDTLEACVSALAELVTYVHVT
jgi:transcription-repair coupling factor (superfamily II helicase)